MGARMSHGYKVIVIVTIFAGLALFVLFWNLSAPYEVSKKIWLPQNHSIVNLMQGKHIKEIIRVVPSGTLLWLGFNEYKKQLADVKGTVVIGGGEIYYFAKTDEGVTFASEVSYRDPWQGGNILSIAKNGTMLLYRERNIPLLMVALAVNIFALLFCVSKRKSMRV